MKGKNLQPRIVYPERLPLRIDGEIKSFTDKQKLREFSTTKPASQQMLKELLCRKHKRRKRYTNNKPKQLRNRIIIIAVQSLSRV